MTDVEFNPEAKDGDNDGIIQEGTPFERPVEEAEVNPVVVEEVVEAPAVAEDVITAPEPAEEIPAIVPVADGVIGTGKAKKAPKKEATPAPDDNEEKVAIFATRNLYWEGLGRINAGYSIVSKTAANKWLTLSKVREATPAEVKANLG